MNPFNFTNCAKWPNQKGALSVSLVLILAVLFCGAMGTLEIFHLWQVRVENQLALDRCVGKISTELKGELLNIEVRNGLMTALRVQLMDPFLPPPVRMALSASLQGIDFLQMGAILKWRLKQSLWLTGSLCLGRALPKPISTLPYSHLPPDPIGPQPLRLLPKSALHIRILAFNGSLYSAAEIEKNDTWKIFWTSLI